MQPCGAPLPRAVLPPPPPSLCPQVDNGIPIESWFDDRGDTELLKLIRFLDPLQAAPDVRPLVRDRFRVWKLVADATPPPGAPPC